ncbi:IclR family transcriptional regulator [Cupriavidus oxalaticus]|uniref:IclR family transcriptional regulator n=1 Tax=Cupriavidus oxalaticus TaxID=96344 RepID=A0A5P3VS26_9BURK|nr:IclR family transcriptional regulator [Cupriavidus oxalaticus]QEZ48917.1 IclR family transcriptional regulator [Cupriavidus oxalaticus]
MPQIVPTANRVLQVFEVFAREGRPLGNSELARLLDLADSSCSDLLFTMREAGYLMRTPKTRQFYPTARLNDVAVRIASLDPLHAFASEALEILTKESGETSLCGYMEGDHVKVFACQESPHALRYVVRPGAVFDLHATALGKAILAAMPKAEREALMEKLSLQPVTSSTIHDVETLRTEIDKCARVKWCLAKDEGVQGVSAIGIAGTVGGSLASLSLVGPTQRIEENLDRYVSILLDARREFFL